MTIQYTPYIMITIFRKLLTPLLLMNTFTLQAVDKDKLADVFREKAPFDYQLGVRLLPGPTREESVMICFHGYGADHLIGDAVRTYPVIRDHIVSFNFPDYGIMGGGFYDPSRSSFGSIRELLPAFYVMKKIVIDAEVDSINLYGFSAGGGVIINAIAVLNGNRYDDELKKLGIGEEEKKKILSAIQKGLVILDSPLKSIDEIMDFRGHSEEFEILAKRYHANQFTPIDALQYLKNVPLTVFVYFDVPDEILSNRDDALYVERLKSVNAQGKTFVIFGSEGGHCTYHQPLWKAYQKFLQQQKN